MLTAAGGSGITHTTQKSGATSCVRCADAQPRAVTAADKRQDLDEDMNFTWPMSINLVIGDSSTGPCVSAPSTVQNSGLDPLQALPRSAGVLEKKRCCFHVNRAV